jgi:hypothetical protein
MLNLIKTKELNNIKNKISLGVLGAVAAMIPQTAESQERQIEKLLFLQQRRMKVLQRFQLQLLL